MGGDAGEEVLGRMAKAASKERGELLGHSRTPANPSINDTSQGLGNPGPLPAPLDANFNYTRSDHRDRDLGEQRQARRASFIHLHEKWESAGAQGRVCLLGLG